MNKTSIQNSDLLIEANTGHNRNIYIQLAGVLREDEQNYIDNIYNRIIETFQHDDEIENHIKIYSDLSIDDGIQLGMIIEDLKIDHFYNSSTFREIKLHMLEFIYNIVYTIKELEDYTTDDFYLVGFTASDVATKVSLKDIEIVRVFIELLIHDTIISNLYPAIERKS